MAGRLKTRRKFDDCPRCFPVWSTSFPRATHRIPNTANTPAALKSLSQVSCLACSLSYQVPLLLAGTTEGTVFVFSMPEPTALVARDGSGDGRRVSRPSDMVAGVRETELGTVLMKFEHTTVSIESVSCSQEQVATVAIGLYDAVALLRVQSVLLL